MPGQCRPCGLWRTSAVCKVPGDGDPGASLVLIGEALGEEEERLALPFQGRAGWVLNTAIMLAGLVRSALWVTNSVRCRPLNAIGKNRTPTAQEIGFCNGWLEDELAALPNKRVLVCLGASAAQAVLGADRPSGGVLDSQGKIVWSPRFQCWVVLTVHPAWLLRKPGEIDLLVADLEQAQRTVETGQPPAPQLAEHIEIAHTLDDVRRMKHALAGARRWFWDWETTGLHDIRDVGFCVSFAYRPAPEAAPVAYVVPRYRQGMFPYWHRRDLPRVDAELREIFLSPVEKGGHNVSFDYRKTRGTLGVAPVNVKTCTMIKHHLPFPHYGERAHGLKRMSQRYLKYGRYDEPLDEWLTANGHTRDGKPDGGKIWLAPDHLVQPYCGTDSVVTLEMDEVLEPVLEREGLLRMFYEEKMPFVMRYADADFHGVDINGDDRDPARPSELTRLDANLDRAKTATVAQIERLVGHPLNPNSPDQVTKYLYEERGLPIIARTEHGKPSTKEEVLKQFEQVEPTAALILHARLYTKYRGSFVKTMREALDPDGRIRPNTLHHVVETHRLATRKPFAPHVIPRPMKLWSCPAGHGVYLFERCCGVAVETPLSIRQMVIPGRGRVFISGDFVQQEYALAAIISGQQDMEEAMLDRREDAHEWVMQHVGGRSKGEFLAPAVQVYDRNTLARLISEGTVAHPEALVFKSPGAEADYKNLRSDFKAINFSILYRAGAKNVARSLRLLDSDGRPDESRGAQVIEEYYDRLPAIRHWQYQQILALRRTGRSANPFGTYRVLPGISSPDRYAQYEAERQACNAPFQTGGYHVMARAVLRLCAKWDGAPPLRAPFPGRFVLTVHDEILTEAREDLAAEATEDLRVAMETPHPELVGGCGIPRGILSDIKTERAWGGVFLRVPDEASMAGL